MSVSVAMATYNGDKYIREQLLSILKQLEESDEVIVSDDGSSDDTIAIVKELALAYPQIKLIEGPRKGVFKNFEHAITNCTKDIIFFSDQDDVWIDGKVRTICRLFIDNPGINVIMHGAYKMIGEKKTTREMVHYKKGIIANLVKSCYWGCCMAVKTEYIKQYIPYHVNGIAHDQLVGLLAEKDKNVIFDNTCFCYHRFHTSNQTKKRGIIKRIVFRLVLLRDFVVCSSHRHRDARI